MALANIQKAIPPKFVFTGPSPSELNRQVELWSPIRVPDGTGGFTTTRLKIATVWAKITTLRSDEVLIAMATTGTTIHNVVIRYRTDIQASWLIKYKDKFWNILGPPIDLNKAHRWLDIKVKEVG